jgi:hypothetical protein
MRMPPKKTPAVKFLTVLRSESLLHPDKRAAIQLITRELGAIAFEVDQRVINALRQHISTIENFLKQKGGNA